MAKGTGKKPDFMKATEKPAPHSEAVTSDTLSPVDKGKDFVKAGESA